MDKPWQTQMLWQCWLLSVHYSNCRPLVAHIPIVNSQALDHLVLSATEQTDEGQKRVDQS